MEKRTANYYTLPQATDAVLGGVKLYPLPGQNTDGTMTQKAIDDLVAFRGEFTKILIDTFYPGGSPAPGSPSYTFNEGTIITSDLVEVKDVYTFYRCISSYTIAGLGGNILYPIQDSVHWEPLVHNFNPTQIPNTIDPNRPIDIKKGEAYLYKDALYLAHDNASGITDFDNHLNTFNRVGGLGYRGVLLPGYNRSLQGDIWFCQEDGKMYQSIDTQVYFYYVTAPSSALNTFTIAQMVANGYMEEYKSWVSLDYFNYHSGGGGGSTAVLYPSTGQNTDGAMTQKATTDALVLKAPLDSPALTGTPTAPTQPFNDDSTAIATTEYVDRFAAVQSVTFAQLKSLATSGTLVAGNWYLITNYATKFVVATDASSTTTYQGSVEPIYVQADTPYTISREAYSSVYPNDRLWYSIANSTTQSTGSITRRVDLSRGNDTPFDFRNCVFRRWPNAQGKYVNYLASGSTGTPVDMPFFDPAGYAAGNYTNVKIRSDAYTEGALRSTCNIVFGPNTSASNITFTNSTVRGFTMLDYTFAVAVTVENSAIDNFWIYGGYLNVVKVNYATLTNTTFDDGYVENSNIVYSTMNNTYFNGGSITALNLYDRSSMTGVNFTGTQVKGYTRMSGITMSKGAMSTVTFDNVKPAFLIVVDNSTMSTVTMTGSTTNNNALTLLDKTVLSNVTVPNNINSNLILGTLARCTTAGLTALGHDLLNMLDPNAYYYQNRLISSVVATVNGVVPDRLGNVQVSAGTSATPLYAATGQNTDGAMTQKATTDELTLRAPLNSPALTGLPTAPTATLTDSSTKLATTAFVQGSIKPLRAVYNLVSSGAGQPVGYDNFNDAADANTNDTLILNRGVFDMNRNANIAGSYIVGNTAYVNLKGFSLTMRGNAVLQDVSFFEITTTGGTNTAGPGLVFQRGTTSSTLRNGILQCHVLHSGGGSPRPVVILDSVAASVLPVAGGTYGWEGTCIIRLRNGSTLTGPIDPNITVINEQVLSVNNVLPDVAGNVTVSSGGSAPVTFTPTAIRSAIVNGLYSFGELQNGQPSGSTFGMTFSDSNWTYTFTYASADTNGTNTVWTRTYKR